MEDRAMVSYSTGSMNSLLYKLNELKNRPKPILELKQDLESLKKDLLDKFSLQGATDEQVKVWMKQVREVVYDIEDWIDQKPELNLEESEVEEIDEFKAQIQDAHERCTRYALINKARTCTGTGGGDVRSSKLVTMDAAQELGLENPVFFGLAGPKDDLAKHLMDGEHEKLKVVSIVGMGGFGKTTLAKKIHEELRGEFHCGAFVYVGRENPSVRRILQNILRQIKSPHDGDFEDWHDEQKVIAEVWKLLSKKRYFIVLDGIWSIRAWRVISCALPGNNLGSRILTTTRIKDVANSCSRGCTDVIHEMQALSKEDSEKLLCSRIYAGQEMSLVDRKECLDFNDMLNMCRGVPSAIIIAAGLFGRKSAELAQTWMLGKSVLSSSDQVMRKVLQMSYADLPSPVKSCFLYLSIFPENDTIKKDRLIWLWVAEGFIPGRDEESLWETGESCFNELISRRLIQPVFNFDDDQAVGCTVHGVILDFVRSLCREENFATTAAELISDPFPCDAIRRFSLDCSNEDEADTWASSRSHLSSIRSLTVFGDAEGVFDPPELPSDSEEDEDDKMYARCVLGNYWDLHLSFKLIRVLDLEDTTNLTDYHLKGIGGLVLLRYLGLGGEHIRSLPEEIGQLVHLETLDIRRTQLITLPASIVKLRKLVRLLLYTHIVNIDLVLKMPKLEQVSNIRVRNTRTLSSMSELVSKSEVLRILGVTLHVDEKPLGRHDNLLHSLPLDLGDMTIFVKKVVNSDLHSLSLDFRSGSSAFVWLIVHFWVKYTAPSTDVKRTCQLQRFELKIPGTFFGFPPRMASLVSVTHLHIEFLSLEAEGLRVLGSLPKLVLLNLSLLEIVPKQSCIIEGVFSSLKVFSLKYHVGPLRWLNLAQGAMPQLRRLGLMLPASESWDGFDFGIQRLTCLARVHITINCKYSTVSNVEAVEAHIRARVSELPSKPTFELSRIYEGWMKKDKRQHSKE